MRAGLALLLVACVASEEQAGVKRAWPDPMGPLLPIEGGCDEACGPCPASPILLDLGGNDFELTNLAGGVTFDLFPDGTAEHVSWTAADSDDAWLALDRNGNGTIDDGKELFGNFTEQPAPPAGRMRNGYAALAVFDSNGDNAITAADPVFARLRLWHDGNHNGVSEPDELSTLAAHGIVGLSTGYRPLRRIDRYGNVFRFTAAVDRTAGSSVGQFSVDAFLITDALEKQARDHGLVSHMGAVMLAMVAPAQFPCATCGLPYDAPFDKFCGPVGRESAPMCYRCTYAEGSIYRICPQKWCAGAFECRMQTDSEGHVTSCKFESCPPPCMTQ